MSFFNPTSEDRAQKEAREVERAQREKEHEEAKRQAQFNASPRGRARAAKAAGRTIFQIDLPLSQTKARTVALEGAYATSSKTQDYSNLIQSIEAEGWRLEHVGYVYRLTGSQTRDKFWASGQQEAVSGEIVGIYIFRADNPA